MIRQYGYYPEFERLLIRINQIGDYDLSTSQPFHEYDIFKVAGTGYNIDGDRLWRMFFSKYRSLRVGTAIPCIGHEYITMLPDPFTTSKVETEDDQYLYCYNRMVNDINVFMNEQNDNYKRKMAALTESYNALENYNMVEMSGSVSKVSNTQSTPGSITVSTNVYPFDSNSGDGKPESKSTTSANQSTAGYVDANKSMRWASEDAFGETPQGNSVAMSKHTRSGNIGVTTSQQMLDQELKLRYDSIVEEFLARCADRSLLTDWY